MSTDITPNQREILYALGLTNRPEKLQSTNGSLDVYITGGSASGTQYAEGATTSPGTGTLAIGRYNATPPSLTDGQLYGLQLDSSGALKITGSISVGGTTDNSAYTAGTSTGTPHMGFYHSTIDTVTDGRAATVAITSKRAMMVNLQTSAGAETGIAALPLQVSLANTAANATAVKVDGSAVTQPVSLAAETTKVIGVTRTADGSGNLLTATSNALDVNLKTSSITLTISGTVTANAGTNLNTSALALESGGNLATIAGAIISQEATTSGVKGLTAFGAVTTAKPTYVTGKSDALSLDVNGLLRVSLADTPANTNKLLVTPDALPANQSVNVSQINAVTPLMGNGLTGTGSQRVTIASDNTAFSVNATLSAETTKVIGVVRNSDGAGNLWTSNSTTYTAKFGQDSNLLGTLGTAFSTAGKVDIKAADGDVFVRQTTGSNLHVVTDSGTITTVSAVTAITNALPVGSNVIGKVSIDQTTPGTTNLVALAANQSINNAQVAGTAVSVNNGTSDAGTTRVTIASNSTGQVALAAGTAAVGDVNVNPAARGGYSTYFANAVTTVVTVSGGAGKFGGYMLINLNAAPAYLQFFDTTGAVTLGTTAPTFVIPIPANATAANGLAANLELVNGAALTNGLKMAATTTSTGASTVATGVTGTVWYK